MGRIFNTAGDSVLADFASAVDATRNNDPNVFPCLKGDVHTCR